jgi:hypothetical protein
MPNGRPGDHPLTDILHYGWTVFGPEIDGLVRELALMPGYDRMSDRVANLLWDNWPAWQNVKTDYDEVRRELLEIRAKLQRHD